MLFKKKKSRAEMVLEKILTDREDTIRSLECQNRILQCRVETLQKVNDDLKGQIETLQQQIDNPTEFLFSLPVDDPEPI